MDTYSAARDELQALRTEIDSLLRGSQSTVVALHRALLWLERAHDYLSVNLNHFKHRLEIAKALRSTLRVLNTGERLEGMREGRATLSAPAELFVVLKHKLRAADRNEGEVVSIIDKLERINDSNFNLVEGAIKAAEAVYAGCDNTAPATSTVAPPAVTPPAPPRGSLSRFRKLQDRLKPTKHAQQPIAVQEDQVMVELISAFSEEVKEHYQHKISCDRWFEAADECNERVKSQLLLKIEDVCRGGPKELGFTPLRFGLILLKRDLDKLTEGTQQADVKGWKNTAAHLYRITNNPHLDDFDHTWIEHLLETAKSIESNLEAQAENEAWHFEVEVDKKTHVATNKFEDSIGHRAAKRYGFDRNAFNRRAKRAAF